MSKLRPRRYHLNVVGPFYVEDECCMYCGVPEAHAPALFGLTDGHCWVKRQPETAEELETMLNVMAMQDLKCIRYAGSDSEVRRRIDPKTLDDPE